MFSAAHPPFFRAMGLFVILAGITTAVISIIYICDSIIGLLLPSARYSSVEAVLEKRHLQKGPKIAAIGGGTGISVILAGLKSMTSNITAVVTVTDEGGSSGRLRRDFETLPPGDIRNCLVALADAPPLLGSLFQYRFDKGEGLEGHNFGNLFILAMTKVTGDFERAISESSKVLAIRGRVVPSTLESIRLICVMKDGSTVNGETNIVSSGKKIHKVSLSVENIAAANSALEALNEADIIILGPGSLYTSILPNLLIPGIRDAVKKSSALKVYICNIMTQKGETRGYTVKDHVAALTAHAGKGMVDYVIMNSQPIPAQILERYHEEHSGPVVIDPDIQDYLQGVGVKGIAEDVMLVNDMMVRHDADKITRMLAKLYLSYAGHAGNG